MAQSAVVRDYRPLETGRRRSNRLVPTVAGYEAYHVQGALTMRTPLVCARPRTSRSVNVASGGTLLPNNGVDLFLLELPGLSLRGSAGILSLRA